MAQSQAKKPNGSPRFSTHKCATALIQEISALSIKE